MSEVDSVSKASRLATNISTSSRLAKRGCWLHDKKEESQLIKGAINYGSSDGAEELDSIILHGKAIGGGGRMNRDALRSDCVQLRQIY